MIFKRYFRLTRSTFEWLCCEVIPLLRRNNNEPGIIGLAWEQKIGTSLWFLTTGECFRSIGERFGMGESTVSYALRQFFDVIIARFLAEKIIFLNTELEINRITNGFERIGKIPNVIGAIDGSGHLFLVSNLLGTIFRPYTSAMECTTGASSNRYVTVTKMS